jgi:hypothetical protein
VYVFGEETPKAHLHSAPELEALTGDSLWSFLNRLFPLSYLG